MGVDSRKFLCCLPVRLGVFVLSFFSFLGGGFLAGAIWYEFSKQYALPGVQKAAFIIAGVSWSALALFSLAGLIGSITRSRALVATYATFMWIHFWFDVAVSAFFIYSLYAVNPSDYLKDCVAQSNGTLTQQQCADVLKYARIIYIVVVVVLSLIQLYCSIIVSRYVAQLSDEAAFKAVNHMGNAGFAHGQQPSQASYYPHKALARSDPDEHHELLTQKGNYHDNAYHAQGPYNPPAPGAYAYTDPHNAFGGNNAHKV